MSKVKKILLGVLLSVLTLTVIVDTLLLVIIWQSSPRETVIYPYENSFLKIDDVAYIRSDLVYPDVEKVENDEVERINRSDIESALNEAIEKRDQNITSTS